MMDLRLLPSIPPEAFVEMTIPIGRKEKVKKFAHFFSAPHLLPLYMLRSGEREELKIGMAWAENGLSFGIEVDKPLEESFFPDAAKGDALFLLLDTRGVAGAKTLHKYCHHFLFLPKGEEGLLGREVTRFRLEDRHPLCPSETLHVEVREKRRSYQMEIEIPEISLFGYDPYEYKKMKFALLLYRKGGDPFCFPLNGEEYKLETHPELWTFIELI